MVLSEEGFEFKRSRHPGRRLDMLAVKRQVEKAHKRWKKRKHRSKARTTVAAIINAAIAKDEEKQP